ncbi:MAG: glycosyltransferase, partial [Candidatus Staskawiczbacteria bacterium]|nr:glycosyltransferase [Candidatus Staskawiczbacteria bacterium]
MCWLFIFIKIILPLPMTRIAVFKPFNIRKDSAFFSGQHGVFRYLQEKLGYQVTYFIEGETAEFSPVGMRFLHRNKLITLMMRILRKLFSWQKYYWKIPYYSNLDFSGYDIIITEGMHYLLLDYVKHVAKKVILNDSISSQVHLPAAKIRFLKTYFTHAVVVTVNEKIPGIYKAYGLDFKATAIGHAVSVEQIPFLARTASKGKLVSVGRLAPEKGFAYIIEAVSQLQKKYPAITLDIYGEGPLHKNLVELIHALKLENTVFLRG